MKALLGLLSCYVPAGALTWWCGYHVRIISERVGWWDHLRMDIWDFTLFALWVAGTVLGIAVLITITYLLMVLEKALQQHDA